jgi:hypothetical protein
MHVCEWIARQYAIVFPWDGPHPDGKNLHLAVVPAGTDEHNEILERVQRTMSREIIQVQRVQNKRLWTQFVQSKQKLKGKLQKDPPEVRLFHGTRTLHPEQIYDGESSTE